MKVSMLMKELSKRYGKSRIGSQYSTIEGYTCIIIDGSNRRNYCTIQIEDWVSEAQYSNVKRGLIKYPLHKSTYTVGCIGVGRYSNKLHKNAYCKWSDMLQRCYDKTYQGKQPAYKGVTVCTEWLNFQNFAKWYYKYYPTDGLKYELDKDLLKGVSGVYSPSTCLFLPARLNQFMANTQLNSTSGLTGVSLAGNKWRARITIDSKTEHLGYFTNKKEAGIVYQQARTEQAERWKRYYSFDYPKHILDKLK